jgi:hypothetical protein
VIIKLLFLLTKTPCLLFSFPKGFFSGGSPGFLLILKIEKFEILPKFFSSKEIFSREIENLKKYYGML